MYRWKLNQDVENRLFICFLLQHTKTYIHHTATDRLYTYDDIYARAFVVTRFSIFFNQSKRMSKQYRLPTIIYTPRSRVVQRWARPNRRNAHHRMTSPNDLPPGYRISVLGNLRRTRLRSNTV